MKKTRKQPALAKCVLATIMAMGMMGYTTVWADTPTPSPVDKDVSKDANGQIYDASHNYQQGYFWTDLGHAQVQIGSGEQIELFTPFIYHTHNGIWDPKDRRYDPVHTGDNSEMKCKESMSRITVGEFDRIIKSLYTNDITMAKTIYGEAGQAGLKDTVIKAVRATPGQGKTVNTYELVRANDEVLAAAIVDTDTKITGNELTFADGKLNSKITDNAGGIFESTVEGIASQGWVNEQMQGIVDTNTTNTGMEGSLDEYGKLTVKVKDSDQRSVQAEVEGVASRSWVTNQLEGIAGIDTVTTVESKTNMLKITDEGIDGNHAYKVDINGDQLGDFVQQYDTNTVTTAQADGKGYVNVAEMVDDNGNYNYTVGINEDKLINTIKDNDTNTITTAESIHDIITVNNSMEGQEDGKNYQIGINEDALKGYNDTMSGVLDGAGLNASAAEQAKTDGVFDTLAYVSATDATTFSAFLNVNRAATSNVNDGSVVSPKEGDEEAMTRTHAAFLNVHFRRAIMFALDRATYNAQTVGEDLKYASLVNTYTPGNFVSLEEDTTVDINGTATTFPAGTYYGAIVQAQIDADGLTIKVWDPEAEGGAGSSTQFDGWYNPDEAAAELATAVEELAAEGVEVSAENPIYMDIPYFSGSEAFGNRANALKKSIETVLGGAVIVNLVECVDSNAWYYAGYYTDFGYEANYDFYDVSGWGPDYGDPQTYLDTFLPDYSGYMVKCIGLF